MELRLRRNAGGCRVGREGGQTLVVAAVVLLGLVGFLAMVVDLGNVYAQRRRMQNAADAAALAACRALALEEGEASAREAAGRYAQANGAASWSTAILTSSVVVSVNEAFPTYFASVLGVPTFSVGAIAAAAYEPAGPWQGDLMPLAVHSDALKHLKQGDEIQIWDSEETVVGENVISDGQRGWLNFNGHEVSDSELVGWITYGYDGQVEPNQWINGTPGTKTSAMHAMGDVRIRTTIYVPIYDTTRAGQEGNGQLDYRIVGVAAFDVVNVVDRGSPKYIEGKFRPDVVAQKRGGKVDTGVRVVYLSN
ncbi:MAG: pilus assembly protein TadG-related protein [Anaerolineae bacterium]|nr:pilus assembly protein TadG-related protein [Anaerolineae bacterium]